MSDQKQDPSSPALEGEKQKEAIRDLMTLLSHYEEAFKRAEKNFSEMKQHTAYLESELAGRNKALAVKSRLESLGEMAAGVAHEVRNPLGAIRLFAGLIKRRPQDDETLRYLERIIKGVEDINEIIHGMLSLARPKFVWVDSEHLCQDLTTAVETDMRDTGGNLVLHDGGVKIYADRRMLVRALINLVANALVAATDHGQHDGDVSLQIKQDDGDVLIVVEDSGPGIPLENRDKVFDPFFTTKDDGTGLGLSIVFRTVMAHGGTITVGESLLGGAQFKMCLPLPQDDTLQDKQNLNQELTLGPFSWQPERL